MNTFPPDVMMKTISYYYLVNYCPPSHVGDLVVAAQGLRGSLAEATGMEVPAYFEAALPEVCWRIVAFHQASREPDPEVVQALVEVGSKADSSEAGAQKFQAAMADIAANPGRAKPDNRLHRHKGCRFCAAPCRYGYFSLVSEPVFKRLLGMLESENEKPAQSRDPVNVLWTYTMTHLWSVLGIREGFIRADHLGNLSYCLLMLATAKSRFALPEKQLQAFQTMNRDMIRGWRPVQIDLMGAAEGS